MFYAFYMLSYVFLCYEICYDMYVCRLGHMTHMTNKPQIDYGHMTCLASRTPLISWAYDLFSLWDPK